MDSEPARPDYELDEVAEIDTPQKAQALADPLRSLIVDLVLTRAMSIADLANSTGKPRSTVTHHVDVLVQAELIRVVRTRKVRAIEERFYGRTAWTYHYVGPMEGTQLPFIAEAQQDIDWELAQSLPIEFTLRRARMSEPAAQEFIDKLMEISMKFVDAAVEGEQEYALFIGLFPTRRIPKK